MLTFLEYIYVCHPDVMSSMYIIDASGPVVDQQQNERRKKATLLRLWYELYERYMYHI